MESLIRLVQYSIKSKEGFKDEVGWKWKRTGYLVDVFRTSQDYMESCHDN